MKPAPLLRLPLVLGLLGLAFAAFGTGTARAECGEEGSDEIAFQGSGKLLVALCAPKKRSAVVRLDRTGRLDPSFAGDGSLGPWRSNVSPHLAVSPQRRLLVQMTLGKGKSRRVVLRRFSADGKLDRSFAGGNAIIPSKGASPEQFHVFSQPQGTAVVAYYGDFDGCFGNFCAERTNYLQLYRYSAAGKRIGEARYYTEYWDLHNVTMAPDGDILVAGDDGEYATLTFLRTKPSLKRRTSHDEPEEFDAGLPTILPGPGRSVLISAGRTVERYGPDWSLDESFGEAGFAGCGGEEGFLEAIASLPSGAFLAEGNSAECGLMRYLADGRPDPTFGSAGSVDLAELGLASRHARIESLAVGPGGEIAIAVGNDQYKPILRIYRLSAEGQLETGFGTDGVVTVRSFQPG